MAPHFLFVLTASIRSRTGKIDSIFMETLDGNTLGRMQFEAQKNLPTERKVVITLNDNSVVRGIVRKYEYAANEPHLLSDVILDDVRVNVMAISNLEFI